MKKIIIILLLAIMMCLAGVACGSEAEKADKYCWNCGKGLAYEASFCDSCGANVINNTNEVSPSPTGTLIPKVTETPNLNSTSTPEQTPTVHQSTQTPFETTAPIETQKPVETQVPTVEPTATPTQKPTATPTQKPTATPTQKPTATPTQKPTDTPHTHSYGDWVVVKDATENEEGLQERLCVCGDKETKIIDKIRYSEGLSYLSNNSGYTVFRIGTCKDSEIIIPASYQGLPVTQIHSSAFYKCKQITSVIIPDSVTIIGDFAFDSCENLTSITIPDSVTILGDGAFAFCKSLTSVSLGTGITKIFEETFWGCDQLTTVLINGKITSIGYQAFTNCKSLEQITFNGTIEEWYSVVLEYQWNYHYKDPGTYARIKKIICLDGTVYIPVS